MNAIRALGGRFLELDERSGIYNDIGDKKATEKTSQALREGQKDIRQELYKSNEMDNFRQMSDEGYFGYSVQVLESLYCGDAQSTAAGPTPPATMQQYQTQPPPPADLSGSANSHQSAAMMAALDQFPGAAQQMPSLPPASKGEAAQAQAMEDLQRPTIGRFTDTSMRITEMGRQSSFRLTNMSMLSGISGISDLIESARNYNPQQMEAAGGDRDTGIQSVLTSEIRDLIRMSEAQLMQADTFMGGQRGTPPPVKMDTEVVMKDAEDRVSELRFTDVSRPAGESPSASSESMKNDRQSSATNYSKTSLMDASMMTIDKDDMSTHSGSESDAKRQKPSPQDAHLLLGLGDKTKEEAV